MTNRAELIDQFIAAIQAGDIYAESDGPFRGRAKHYNLLDELGLEPNDQVSGFLFISSIKIRGLNEESGGRIYTVLESLREIG